MAEEERKKERKALTKPIGAKAPLGNEMEMFQRSSVWDRCLSVKVVQSGNILRRTEANVFSSSPFKFFKSPAVSHPFRGRFECRQISNYTNIDLWSVCQLVFPIHKSFFKGLKRKIHFIYFNIYFHGCAQYGQNKVILNLK